MITREKRPTYGKDITKRLKRWSIIMNKVQEATKEYLKKDIPDFDTGDTLIVSVLVREGNKERVQNFEGVVIGRRAGDIDSFIYSKKDFKWSWC